MSPHVDELLALAVDTAQAAGALAFEGRPQRALRTSTKSTPTDVVTEMDLAAERLIIDQLLAARPTDAVLAEEGGGSAPSIEAEVRWVIDPIDGTVNYLYGLPHWAVSIGIEVGGQVAAGVVHAPALGSTWTATRGGGARHNGVPITLGDPATLDQALVATGFGYAQERRQAQGAVVSQLLPQVRDIRRLGAASLDLAMVAMGSVDAYFERGLQPWDLAAGGLIATEAGAVVGGLRGSGAGEDMVVAAGPGLFEALEAALVAAGA